MNKIILLAGGSGLVGKRLQHHLREKSYDIRILTRKPKAENEYFWDPLNGEFDDSSLEGVHGVINLAGAGIADKRWTAKRKKLLIDSRVYTARILKEHIGFSKNKPEVYLSASGVGGYGDTGDALIDENTAPVGDGFMVECCQLWEQEAQTLSQTGLRTGILRIGIVLSRNGGAVPEIEKPMNFGVAGYFGSGKNWWSWIHIDDLCKMFIWMLENDHVKGVYNAVAPNPSQTRGFTNAIRKASGKKALLIPAPAFGLRLVFGEMADTLLYSNKVNPDKAIQAGFDFEYSELEDALNQLYSAD